MREVVRYKQEYQITRSLECLAGVIRVRDLMSYGNSLAMVLEDFGGVSFDRLIGEKSLTLREFLDVVIPMVRFLGEIHSANVIHKDVNPSNVVYNPHTGELKFIDFGISTDLSRESPTTINPALLEGTLAYILPEQNGYERRLVPLEDTEDVPEKPIERVLKTRERILRDDAAHGHHLLPGWQRAM